MLHDPGLCVQQISLKVGTDTCPAIQRLTKIGKQANHARPVEGGHVGYSCYGAGSRRRLDASRRIDRTPGRKPDMRELDKEERQILEVLEGPVATDDLIMMV